MPSLPAICNNDKCKAVFPSNFAVSGKDATVIGCGSGPCPKCGSMGRVPDGKYSALSDGIEAILSSNIDIEILNQLHRTLSSSISSNDFSKTKSELNKIAPNWANVWGLFPENDVISAMAVYTFTCILLQTGIMAHNSFKDEDTSKTIIHHHYPQNKIDSDFEKDKQDNQQQNQKHQLKPLILAIKIALHNSSHV